MERISLRKTCKPCRQAMQELVDDYNAIDGRTNKDRAILVSQVLSTVPVVTCPAGKEEEFCPLAPRHAG